MQGIALNTPCSGVLGLVPTTDGYPLRLAGTMYACSLVVKTTIDPKQLPPFTLTLAQMVALSSCTCRGLGLGLGIQGVGGSG